MFYLKYRPQTIEEIDNQAIREKIKTFVSSKKISHALLFAGPKGTGKTSTARILAKIVNCQNNFFAAKSKSSEPCNQCDNCRLITKDSSLDVVEIDAASNRGIDEIRSLIEQVKFVPVHCRFKVYIIDEVHMLTKESFNAFLKTLEEPPTKVIFVLATTQAEKLPKTVISRCIRFNFAKAKDEEILRMLKRISQKEKISTKDEVLNFIARHCDHSFRDAAKIFEEAVILKTLDLDGLKKILGLGISNFDLLKSLEKKDLKKALYFIESFSQQGGDFKTLIESSLDSFHLLLLKKNRVDVKIEEDYNFSLKETARLIKLFQEAYNSLKYSPIEALPLELAVVEFIKGGEK